MINLLAKLEADLNCIPMEKSKILANRRLNMESAAIELAALEQKRLKLAALINSYIKLQNEYLELSGQLAVNY